MKKISFVIPCYRSEKTIEGVVGEIESTMEILSKEKNYSYEIILVNDCSPDNTMGAIRRLCEEKRNRICP